MSPRAALTAVVCAMFLSGVTTAGVLQARSAGGAARVEAQGRFGAPSGPRAPAIPVVVSIFPSGPAPITPTTPVVVTAIGGVLTAVSVTAVDGTPVAGQLVERGRRWRSSGMLGYGHRYTVLARATNSQGQPTQRRGDFTTLAPRELAYPNMIPAPGSVDSIGVGQPIVFQFKQPVRNRAAVEKQLRVSSQPPQEGAWYWIDDRDVHYRPKQFWQSGSVVAVAADVYGVDFGDGVYGAENRHVTYRVHDSWIAKADGSSQSMAIFHNGALVKTMPISMGKRQSPTHRGVHVVSFKKADYIMDSCTYGVCKGEPGYYRSHEKWSARVSNDGEFVHENPNSVAAQGNSNVSYGCINLNARNAEWFYTHFSLGDVVDVVNSGGPPLPVWDLYGDWSLAWPEWQAGDHTT